MEAMARAIHYFRTEGLYAAAALVRIQTIFRRKPSFFQIARPREPGRRFCRAPRARGGDYRAAFFSSPDTAPWIARRV
jgi:hypothetical protein